MTAKHEEELEKNGNPSNRAKQRECKHGNSAQGRHIKGKTEEHAMEHSTNNKMGSLEMTSHKDCGEG